MRYLTVDGMLSGTGIRDSVSGEYLDPSTLGISQEVVKRIEEWLSTYQDAHIHGFSDLKQINELDEEGVQICRLLQEQMPKSKFEYYSSAKCERKLP